ncbi:thiopurine S-methyltransferase [Pseudomonas sp. R5(2019)]|uniref:thiopurine S-methyltransferase n=1 Tax=Pseudomonas sp. R5(2019) TaxID=2697566 RepID=UPI001413419A|nr:thiopurine S-methyltransferase [Pseudomonas sp. R5(2019)]NBA98544.1 thiopurine S-methyltransferase [Pseudomonas sp. R5(2019)]
MQPEFWHKRWESGQIGFHLGHVNPLLLAHWPGLGLPAGARVLVPLCGKSLDLAWLASQGLRVLGVELAQKAVEDFFREHGLTPERSQQGAFEVFRAGSVELWCGDVFALTAEDLADCVGLYDRAALIALPPPMRQRYVQHLATLLPEQCKGLLITMDYDQAQIEGPPFSVPDDEVQALMAGRWQVTELQCEDILGESWKFVQAGVSRLQERVYRLESL